jgi:hypothetical protein
MIFPKTTEFNQKIPKERFYKNLEVNNKTKREFIETIDSIILRNKLAKDTLNIPATKEIEEIFVLEIKLKKEENLENVEDILLLIDRAIPYPILYLIFAGDKLYYKIAYKKRNKVSGDYFVVETYFSREIENEKMFEKELKPIFNSLNLEILYERLIRIISGSEKEIPIEELVEHTKQRRILEKEIGILENKIKIEKQTDKQYKLFEELGTKKKGLEEI